MLSSLVHGNVCIKQRMKTDLWKIGFSFKLPLHTHRLQRSNHSGKVRMRAMTYVQAPDDKGKSIHKNFIYNNHDNNRFKTWKSWRFRVGFEYRYIRCLTECICLFEKHTEMDDNFNACSTILDRRCVCHILKLIYSLLMVDFFF